MSYKFALAAVLITGGITGLMAPLPDDSAPQEDAELADTRADRATSGKAASARSSARDVVLSRQEDGHFYADVEVNGRYVTMLVDTGATVVALTGDDADSMGIHWNYNDVTYVGQGASGPVEGVNTVIDRMSAGGHEVTNVEAIIIPEGAGISLLGQSYLRTLERVEMSGDVMIMGNGER